MNDLNVGQEAGWMRFVLLWVFQLLCFGAPNEPVLLEEEDML